MTKFLDLFSTDLRIRSPTLFIRNISHPLSRDAKAIRRSSLTNRGTDFNADKNVGDNWKFWKGKSQWGVLKI